MTTRILVVDDEPAVCELVREMLTTAGMGTETTTESSQAASLLAEHKFDAVFLDVRMPPPDGLELLRRIRTTGFNQKTPVILMTADDDPGALRRGFEAGANFFLFKPISRRRLMHLVRASQASIQREKRRYQRVPIRLKVSMESSHGKVEGDTLDLSLGGLLVQAGSVLPLDTPVEIALSLGAAGRTIRARGRVVRSVGTDCIGIQFESIGPADSDRLQEFLLPLILAATDG